uniref:Uncharacterized protein n=1 Tax=Oryza nivara TaxID=4536 RepID=A0A0E0IBL3_ORYNI
MWIAATVEGEEIGSGKGISGLWRRRRRRRSTGGRSGGLRRSEEKRHVLGTAAAATPEGDDPPTVANGECEEEEGGEGRALAGPAVAGRGGARRIGVCWQRQQRR